MQGRLNCIILISCLIYLPDDPRDMAANLALLIGPSYANDLPDYCGPLEGVENDLDLLTDMLCRKGFLLENIKVSCEEIVKLNMQGDNLPWRSP